MEVEPDTNGVSEHGGPPLVPVTLKKVTLKMKMCMCMGYGEPGDINGPRAIAKLMHIVAEDLEQRGVTSGATTTNVAQATSGGGLGGAVVVASGAGRGGRGRGRGAFLQTVARAVPVVQAQQEQAQQEHQERRDERAEDLHARDEDHREALEDDTA